MPVAVVNEALAREYFPDADPIGQQVRLSDLGDAKMPWLTIVGVVGDVKHAELMNEMNWVATPILYRPLAQEPRPSVAIVVRTGATAVAVVGQRIQHEIVAMDASIPLSDADTVESRLSKSLAYPRFRAFLVGLFALMALMVSAVGLHGVLSQLVAQRTSEFGVRRAVGASTRSLLLLVARQGGVPVVAGLAAGLVCTLAGGRVLGGLLYGVEAVDPATMSLVSAVLLIVAGLAMALPARRAAMVDPMVALREE